MQRSCNVKGSHVKPATAVSSVTERTADGVTSTTTATRLVAGAAPVATPVFDTELHPRQQCQQQQQQPSLVPIMCAGFSDKSLLAPLPSKGSELL